MRFTVLLALFLFLPFSSGCLSPAALGTVETTDSGVPMVVNHIGQGKSEGYCIAEYDAVTAATLRAAKMLSLELKESKAEANRTFFRFTDARKDEISIYIRRRSDTMTSIEYDVGWFGSTAFGRLMYRQIIAGLPQTKTD